MFFYLGPAAVEHGPLHQGKSQIDQILQQGRPAAELPQLKGRAHAVQGGVQRLLQQPVVPLRPKSGRHRVIAPVGQVLCQVVPGVYQIDPAAQVIEQLLQYPVPGVIHRSGALQQPGEGIRRPVHGGAVFPL